MKSEDPTASKPEDDRILGLSRSQVSDLSAEELTNNPTAIKMLLHYYGKLVDDNSTLKNDNNTLKTYVNAYQTTKSNSATGTILLTLSNVSIGFGVTFLSSSNVWTGLFSLLTGLAMIGAGIYFAFWKDRS